MHYSESDIMRLHRELYGILEEIHRICVTHKIPYFLIGGSAIGLYYDGGILPWDDDVDIAMTRENYNRFIEIAQRELSSQYFLSTLTTDIHSPFFYAKVKKNQTLFVEERYKDLSMHHGIFVDIFPIDKMPTNGLLRRLQYRVANFLKCCLMSKEVWMWEYFGKCQIEQPLPRSRMACFFNKIVNFCLTKNNINRLLILSSTAFNKSSSKLWGNVVTTTDYVRSDELATIQEISYGPIMAYSILNLEPFLLRNFPTLHRYTDEEVNLKGCNHAPLKLCFNE